jgi:hypothetical protein
VINARFGLATRLLGFLAATPIAAAGLADVYTSTDLAVYSGGKTTVGWKSTVGGSIASWQDITIESQAAIDGDLLAGGAVSLGWKAEAGAVSEDLAPADFAGLALPQVDLAPSGLALTSISQYENRALAPGTFGNLAVDWRGSVTLSAGDYYFDQLSFGSESQLVLDTTDGPVTIHVAGDADFAWQTSVSQTADDGAAALIVGGRVGIADQIDFAASVLAGGPISVGWKTTVTGQLWAHDNITLSSEANVEGGSFGGFVGAAPEPGTLIGLLIFTALLGPRR